MSDPLAKLSRQLHHEFRDPQLLEQALTHRSAGGPNNERLEFFGDALINFIVAEALFAARPQAAEGDLTRLRASLVREESLARIGEQLELSEVLKLGPGELKSGGFRRTSTLANAVEALIGAIYLDGGFEAARRSCLHLYRQALAELPDASTLKDPKTRLQELLQGRGRPLPRYEVMAASGPAHRRQFEVRCTLADAELSTQARAASRRAGEQLAAEEMLARLQETSDA